MDISEKEFEVIKGLYSLWIPNNPSKYLRNEDENEDERMGIFLDFNSGRRWIRLTTYKADNVYDRWSIIVEEKRDASGGDTAFELIGEIVIDTNEWVLGPRKETLAELMLILKKNYII